MAMSPGGPAELDRDECVRLLRGARLGRLVYTEQALPAVVPVAYVVCEDALIVRTDGLAVRMVGSVVAVEADAFVDSDVHAGWSVVVVGVATAVADPGELAELPPLPADGQYLRIGLDRVTGRWAGPPTVERDEGIR